MKVVNTFHQPSSVAGSLKCLLSPGSGLGHLVVAKSSRIEVSSIQQEGLKHECTLEIWGRVVSMRAVAARVSIVRVSLVGLICNSIYLHRIPTCRTSSF